MFRCGQITHFALQALVVSIRTVLGNRLNARLNALPMKEQDILDSFVLFCPVLLITFCSLSDSSSIACHITGDVKNTRPCSIKTISLVSNYQYSILDYQKVGDILQRKSPPAVAATPCQGCLCGYCCPGFVGGYNNVKTFARKALVSPSPVPMALKPAPVFNT
jgi:hypothetical protein